MSFLAPLWLAAAAAAAAGLVALHFFARHRPRPAALPTARFVPEAIARAPSAARKPADLLLLLLRLLVLLVVGAALARPVATSARRPVARVVVLDTAGAGSAPAALDSAKRWAGVGDTVVGAWERGSVGTLSTGLIHALRAAALVRDRADSLELVIVSPFVASSFDAATDSIRGLWPGRARLIAVAAVSAPLPRRITIVGAADDPLRATVALLGARTGAETRMVRGTPTASDTAFARAGGVLDIWPARPDAMWPRAVPDTIGGVTAGDAVVVAPFVRSSTLPRSHAPTLSRFVAWWVDGAPAAAEYAFGSGCIRDIAIPVPANGDLVLRASVRGLVNALASPCGGERSLDPVPASRLAALRGGPSLMASARVPAAERHGAASAWLLGVSALLLLIEMAVRPLARA